MLAGCKASWALAQKIVASDIASRQRRSPPATARRRRRHGLSRHYFHLKSEEALRVGFLAIYRRRLELLIGFSAGAHELTYASRRRLLFEAPTIPTYDGHCDMLSSHPASAAHHILSPTLRRRHFHDAATFPRSRRELMALMVTSSPRNTPSHAFYHLRRRRPAARRAPEESSPKCASSIFIAAIMRCLSARVIVDFTSHAPTGSSRRRRAHIYFLKYFSTSIKCTKHRRSKGWA